MGLGCKKPSAFKLMPSHHCSIVVQVQVLEPQGLDGMTRDGDISEVIAVELDPWRV